MIALNWIKAHKFSDKSSSIQMKIIPEYSMVHGWVVSIESFSRAEKRLHSEAHLRNLVVESDKREKKMKLFIGEAWEMCNKAKVEVEILIEKDLQ